MPDIVPANRPRLSREKIQQILDGDNPQKIIVDRKKYPVVLLGIRGYYANTMGGPGNDRQIYDDCIVIDAPAITVTFNANVDPSIWRVGVATLTPGRGVWFYKIGIHGLSRPKAQQYPALVQAGEVTVHRDNQGSETGYFGINIHRGGYNTTSSLGCQTIYPSQWDSFISTVRDQLKRHGQDKIPYLLVDGPVN